MASSYFTLEEVVVSPTIEDIALADDGSRLAFVKSTADWDKNTFRRHVWVYETATGDCYPQTHGDTESFAPRWSPESRWLAYASPTGADDKKKDQIYVKRAGEAAGVQVSHVEDGVMSFRWAPDGLGFFYIALPPETKELKRRKEIYGDFEYVDAEYRRSCLYYLAIADGLHKTNAPFTAPKDLRAPDDEDKDAKEPDDVAVQLTDGRELHVMDFDIAPDGQRVVLRAAPTPNREDTERARLYLLDVGSKELQDLGITQVEIGPLFSPDGSQICYTRYEGEARFYNNQPLEVLDLGTGETTRLGAAIDEVVVPSRWTEQGIYCWWQDRTIGRICQIKSDGEIVEHAIVDPSPLYLGDVSRDGAHVALIKGSATEPFDLYLDGRRVTDLYRRFEDRVTSKQEVIRWRSADGTEIEGVLSTPEDFDPATKYPLLVIIHGGPTGTSIPVPAISKLYPIEQFVEKGFVVLQPNYRGSAGYGEAFRKLNYRDLGTGDYADVITGVDALIERGFVEREKVGVMGWSQGGYISAFCTTYSDRFKAVSVGAGISNWVTYYVNTDIHQFTRMYLGATPWEDEDVYRKTSPMTHITTARTPTLIQHGDHDTRVPVPNAFELYQGLRDQGVETRLVIFNGMSHGPGKPGLCRAIMKQNLLWFCHHLLGESLDGFHLTVSNASS